VKPLEDLPNSFWCLMTKGEKSRLKLEGLAQFFYLFLTGKIRLSGFTQQNFSSVFSPLVSVDLKNICNM
jgi:hypothetical protein